MKLWCDLKTDQEKAEFLRSGQAWETGIIAKSIQDEVAQAFEYRAEGINEYERGFEDGYFSTFNEKGNAK